MKLVNLYLIFFLSILLFTNLSAESPLVNGEDVEPAFYTFSLDGCVSFTNGSNQDYSEFAGEASNSDCATMDVVGHLYRENPTMNPHSCTPGFEGEAMCVGGSTNCDYEADAEKAIRFDITVNPGNDVSTQLAGLSFYEQAPDNYVWIDGATGGNDYPTLYGVRVLKNGVEVYTESDISTTTGWTLESFDFSDNPDFEVTEETVFSFELLAYCPVGNGNGFYIWDVDEITISTECNANVNGGNLSVDGENMVTVCATEGGGSVIDVAVEGNNGENNTFVITDTNGIILDITDSSTIDFSGAGEGTCLVWNLSWTGDIVGAEIGANAAELEGCFGLSNEVIVIRTLPVAGNITLPGGGEEVTVCTDDNADDIIEVELTGNSGTNSAWVITDGDLNILELPSSPPFDLTNAGGGTCLIWHVSFESIEGAEVGANAGELGGCFDLSNPITVDRIVCEEPCDVAGGSIATGSGTTDLTICAGDGVSDAFDVTLSGNEGENVAWVITDEEGNILDLPAGPPFDFEGAGSGVCLVWAVSYDDIEGVAIGANAGDLTGCYALSNAISVTRLLEGGPCEVPCDVAGGSLSTGSGTTDLTICAGDGLSDAFDVELVGNEGENLAWVITDEEGNILDLPSGPPFDFEGAGSGVCLVWGLSYDDLGGAAVGANASDLTGCYALSNAISVTRIVEGAPCEPVDPCDGLSLDGGTISFADGGSATEVCVNDGVEDLVEVTVTGNQGPNCAWVITDENLNILELPASGPFSFEDAPAGVCLIWNVCFEDIEGAVVGANAADLSGCFDLSNSISVTRVDCGPMDPCDGIVTNGGMITFADGSSTAEVCVNDGVEDLVEVTLTGNEGASCAWVITDENLNILELPASGPFSFEDAPAGVCLIWNVCFDSLEGAVVGANAADLSGCFDLSNSISVTRVDCGPMDPCDGIVTNGGTISFADGGSATEVCVNDGVEDLVEVTLTGNEGANCAWVITDENLNILELPASGPFSFEDAPAGVCLIWNVCFDSLEGAVVGANAADLSGCFDLSNSISVTRVDCGPTDPCDGIITDGGTISFADGSSATEVCVNDGVEDLVEVVLSGNEGANCGWVITDENLNILELPASGPFSFEDAPAGVCLIWNVCFDSLQGAEVGANAADLSGCFDLSNSISVTRVDCGPMDPCADFDTAGGTLSSAGGLTELTFCVADGVSDAFDVNLSGASGGNMAWVITDVGGNILELPAGPPFDFEGLDAGVCLIWNLSFEDGLEGAVVGANAMNLAGCFDLSNPITVNRVTSGPECGMEDCPDQELMCMYGVVDGFLAVIDEMTGEASLVAELDDDKSDISGLTYDPVSDRLLGVANSHIDPQLIAIDRYTGEVTNIGLINQPNPNLMDFRVIEAMSIDRVSGTLYAAGSTSPAPSSSTTLMSVSATSGFATSIATISGTCEGEADEFAFGTGVAYMLDDCGGSTELYTIDLATGVTTLVGSNNLTDGSQLAVNPNSGALYTVSGNTLYSLSTSDGSATMIAVLDDFDLGGVSQIAFAPKTVGATNGGFIAGGPFEMCVGDDIADFIPQGSINTYGEFGSNITWVATGADGKIVGLNEDPYAINFDGISAGTCYLWQLAYDDITGLEVLDFSQDLEGCFDLSNPIEVVRTDIGAGTISSDLGDEVIEVCVGDGQADVVNFTYSGGTNFNTQWVVTSEDLVILDLPESGVIDFEDAGDGVCLVWAVEYNGDFTAEIGDFVPETALSSKCSELTNGIRVERVTSGGVCDNFAPNSELAFTIAPNPAQDYIEVNIESAPSMVGNTIELYNNAGQLVDVFAMPQLTTYTIDLGKYTEGFYYVRVVSMSSTQTKTFAVTK